MISNFIGLKDKSKSVLDARGLILATALLTIILGFTNVYAGDIKSAPQRRRELDYRLDHNFYFTLGYESSFITGLSDGKIDAIKEDMPDPGSNYANRKFKFNGSNELKVSLGLDLLSLDLKEYYTANGKDKVGTKTTRDKISLALELGYNYFTLDPHNVMHEKISLYDRETSSSKSGLISGHDVSLELLLKYKIFEPMSLVLQVGGGYIFYDLDNISNAVIGMANVSSTTTKLNTPYMSTNVGFELNLFEGDGSIKSVFLRIMGEFKYLMKSDYSYLKHSTDAGADVIEYISGSYNINSMGVSVSMGFKF